MNGEKYPLVSIILLNYNGERFSKLWRSIFEINNYPNYEIIFIDNGSRDGSLELFVNLSKNYKRVKTKIIRLENNIGYSKANNLGVTHTRGKYVVLLSNDIEVDNDWLINMIKVFENDESIAVAQSAMYSLYDKNQRDYQCNHIDAFGFCHPPRLSNDVEEVFYSEGAVMFIRKSVIDKVGGLFDEDYFMFDEDIDFCWRVRLRGYKVCVVPSSKVYHARGGTVQGVFMKTDPFYVFLIARNKLATFFKNLELKNLIKYFLPLVMAASLKGIWLIYKGRKNAGVGCFKGILAFLRELPRNYHKRKIVRAMSVVSDKEVLKYMYPLHLAIADVLRVLKKLSEELSIS